MKKKKKNKNTQIKYIGTEIYGHVFLDLHLWEFSGNEDVIRHNAEELAKGLLLIYNMSNFGVESFGLSEK